jgi:hypothetical protein
VVPNISKDCGTFIFKNQAVSEDLTPSLTLEDIKAPQSFQTSVTKHPSTQHCIPEDMNPTLKLYLQVSFIVTGTSSKFHDKYLKVLQP